MKRRQRGQATADWVPGSAAGVLVRESAGATKASADATRRMYRARQSRDAKLQRVRSMDAAAESARRRAEAVVAEQAERTAGLRQALVESRTRVLELERELTTSAETSADTSVVDDLRDRLATGNAAYAELLDTHSKLRAAFDHQKDTSQMVSAYVQDWDLLCRRLYQANRGRQVSGQDRAILQRWSTWRATAKEGHR
ncbi:hypothetical protein [Arthrobacter pigmenti]